jgi:AcrR family transcriptional regulator
MPHSTPAEKRDPIGDCALSKREVTKAQTRLALMRSACDLFEKFGAEATTVEDIAAAANSSSRTFYRYFGSKEDVLFGETAERINSLRKTLSAAQGNTRPMEVVREALIEQVTHLSIHDDPALERRCITLWSSTTGLRGRWAEIVFETEQLVAEYLAREWNTAPENPECRINAMISVSVIRLALIAMETETETGGPARVREIAERGFDHVDRSMSHALLH